VLGALRLAGLLLAACASGPGEIDRLRVENELLREELRIVQQNCGAYGETGGKAEEDPEPGSR
jgi:hypothetical protein